ncbi:MAG TPA: class I SAM-dependent methyltransferase [Patescibacteria group bacterium]|nr:class I SAM-dependent methyltransferase [Patescibacteria group bacterium]
MSVEQVGPSAWLWKEGAGYYTERPEDLAARPVLPDLGRVRERRLHDLFVRFGGVRPGARVLELGCGRSPWLPLLARRHGCQVTGIDIETHAADLALANLIGAGVDGEVYRGDAFALSRREGLAGRFDLVYSMGLLEHFDEPAARIADLAHYLKPGGRILTTVPNLHGVNWMLQRLGSLDTLRAHVVHTARSLALAHERAGFRSIASGYAGFCDGHLSSAAGARSRLQRAIHRRACHALGLGSEAWLRLSRGRGAPELRFLSPHVFHAGRLP